MKIGFDIPGIQEQRTKLSNYADEIRLIKNDLQSAMQQLTSSAWLGNAANAFQTAITDDWCATVDRYCDLMNQLCIIMDHVTKTYEELKESGEKLYIEE